MFRRLPGIMFGLLTLLVFALPAWGRPSSSPTAAVARVLDHGPKWSRADVETVRFALQQGTGLRTQSPRGVTLLMFAARCGDLNLMRSALRAGVDVNTRTHDGLTALWFVMATRNADKVRLLLDHGADPNLTESDGRTPLMLATHFKFRRGIDLLLRRGAKINARNDKGFTALAYTASHPGITRLLRVRGAVE